MALVFECIQTEGIAELSYLLGDDGAGCAALFDPTPDVGRYLALAREKEVAITHVFETHIHADLVSGARELAAAAAARIYLSHEGGASYGFGHEPLKDGDSFTFGETVVSVRHTPGHTPEHLSYLVASREQPEMPWGVLTGDSLFVNSAGRPDLLGSGQTETLTQQLFHTLRNFYLRLPDGVMVFPAHGHGSPCGADIGDRLQSTIGYERRFNPYLRMANFEEFRCHVLEGVPPMPTYYARMKQVNARGPEVLGHLPQVRGLPPAAFDNAVAEKSGVLIDTRTMLAFGGGHIRGALNLGASPLLSIWAGWLLDPEQPILIVLEKDSDVERVVTLFLRTGYTKFAGYLVGGMDAWDSAGLPLEKVDQMTVEELKEASKQLQVLDVRGPGEWRQGHIPGARHVFLAELRQQAALLDRSRPTAVYCGSGYRASIGTSILKQEGFPRVSNVPGSWMAWRKSGFPVEGGNSG
ncbi:MBL fold metallo-hydrolase [bacterium]|nr:MBL fold metallo-hydrolase [bacterium]